MEVLTSHANRAGEQERDSVPVSSVRSVLLPIAGIFLGSRVVLIWLLKAAATYLPPRPDTLGLTGLLCPWDCIWYLSVADIGYSSKEIVEGLYAQTNFCFSPLLPMAVRLLGPLFHGNILYAGLFLTNACFFGALIYIYRYAMLLGFGRTAALLSVTLMCVLPQSIAFSALLSESPFLLLLVMAIYHSRRGDYLIAGLAAALLSATRTNGVLFVAFAALMLYRSVGLAGMFAPWRCPQKFLPLVLAPLGLFVFWAYSFAATGDAFAQVSAEEHGWNWHFYPVWENIPTMLRIGVQSRYAAIAGLITFACMLLLLRERLYEEFAFCCVSLLLILSGSGVVSVFRYWIVLFPVWVVVANVLSRRPIAAALVFAAIGLAGGALLCALALRNPLSL